MVNIIILIYGHFLTTESLMISEIGSEFWNADISENKTLLINSTYEYFLSGRTAIDFIVNDIKMKNKVKSVYMPSYCCHTMIQPFLDNNITVKFYNVNFENGKYNYEMNYENQCDIILIMKYFGYDNEDVDKYICEFSKLGKIIIEDSTHSWLMDNPYNKVSDYVICSFRKWMGIPAGAIAIKSSDKFTYKNINKENHNYLRLRNKAANLKKRYVEEGIGEKQIFLDLFNEAEELLEIDYKNYGVPQDIKKKLDRLEFNKIKELRKKNAKLLYEGLNQIEEIKLLQLNDKDVPLFVPIVVSEGNREKLRHYLIKNKVYSPIHWQLSMCHKIENTELYENGLSLICDQRYNKKDMERIIKLIKDFYGKEL